MPTPSADTAIKRWCAVVQGKSTDRLLNSSSVIAEEDHIFSFGHHFELARVLRDSKGKIRLYLLNGERVSQHTDGHQFLLRKHLKEEPTVIIPYPALREAGINLDSIVLIDDRPERMETIKHRTHEIPEESNWTKGGYIRTPKPKAELLATLKLWNEYRDETNQISEEEFLTDDRWAYQRQNHQYDETLRTLHIGRSPYGPEVTVTRDDDGRPTYEWTTHRHWLGESLIRARVDWLDDKGETHHRWAYFLSGFDIQEPTPLYFLCELPYLARPTTVPEAYEVLKPDPVKMAEQMGRGYTRQGDIFALPTGLTRRELKKRGARFEKVYNDSWREPKGFILNTNHAGTEVAYLPGGLTLARGCLYHRPRGRVPDHVRRKLGDGKAWHIVVKNTVPTAGRR